MDSTELRILAAMVSDPRSLLLGVTTLEAGDFENVAHRMYFELLLSFHQKGRTIAREDIAEYAVKYDLKGIVETSATMATIFPAAYAFPGDVKTLKESRRRREVYRLAEKFLADIRVHSADVDECFDVMAGEFFKLSPGDENIVDSTLVNTYDLRQDNKLYHTGIDAFDKLVGGIAQGTLTMIGGPTSAGKTALGLQIAINQSCPVFLVSREMSGASLLIRVIASDTGLSYNAIKYKSLTTEENEKIKSSKERLTAGHPVIIYDGPRCTVERICNLTRRFRMTAGIELAIIDYLQLLDSSAGEYREREVAHLSSSLKKLSRELKLPVVALSQLNKDGELRESRALEQDADVVVIIEKNKDVISDDAFILNVTKNRNGPLREVPVIFDRAAMRFGNKPVRKPVAAARLYDEHN